MSMNKIFIIGTLVAASILMMTAATSLVGTSVEKSSSELNLQPNQNTAVKGSLASGECCRR